MAAARFAASPEASPRANRAWACQRAYSPPLRLEGGIPAPATVLTPATVPAPAPALASAPAAASSARSTDLRRISLELVMFL